MKGRKKSASRPAQHSNGHSQRTQLNTLARPQERLQTAAATRQRLSSKQGSEEEGYLEKHSRGRARVKNGERERAGYERLQYLHTPASKAAAAIQQRGE